MADKELEVAAEFCKLVDTADLLEYLGLPKDSAPPVVQEALGKKRRRLQSMQSNPKYRDSAKFLIKNYRSFERVLENPIAHLEYQRGIKELELLPYVEIAMAAIMADGHIDTAEETFIRTKALELGISLETYKRRFNELRVENGLDIEGDTVYGTTNPSWAGSQTFRPTGSSQSETERKVRGASGHGWWDATFTTLLLDCIPGGPGKLVDVYCRTALSALTVLPERRQLSYVGVDRNAERLREAQEHLPSGQDISLMAGDPHALPIEDESMDYALAIRALANLSDTEPVMREAFRVLQSGGLFIAVEPNGLAEAFTFDGHLTGYNVAFQRLAAKVDAATSGSQKSNIGKPGLAIGPDLGRRMAHAGFEPTKIAVHASNNMAKRRFVKFAKRLRMYPYAMARQAGFRDTDPDLQAVFAEVDILEKRIPGDTIGMGGHVLPMFLVVGTKE